MFEFKRRNPKASSDGDAGRPPRHFPDGIAAVRFASRFLECPLREGAFLPAVVLDPRELLGPNAPVKTRDARDRVHYLCVASEDGGFVVAATTAGAHGPWLEPGQLVAWKALRYVPEIAAAASDPRFGWAGVIVGTLKPEQRDGRWVGDAIFRSPPSPAAP